MDATLRNRCDLLVRNQGIVNKAIKGSSFELGLSGSLIFTEKDIEVNEEKLKECIAISKDNSKPLSEYRSEAGVPIICNMALSNDPKSYMLKVQEIVDKLKPLKLEYESSKLLSADALLRIGGEENVSANIDKMGTIYADMKKRHPWLVSSDDSVFAALLAISGVDADVVGKESEACYQILKKKITSGDEMQALSHVMAMYPEGAEAKCDRVEQIMALLKEKKHKYPVSHKTAILGLFSGMDIPVEQIVDEIIEVDSYLKEKKGYGNFGLGSDNRLMYAAILVAENHPQAVKEGTVANISSSITVTIAIEICIILLLMMYISVIH